VKDPAEETFCHPNRNVIKNDILDYRKVNRTPRMECGCIARFLRQNEVFCYFEGKAFVTSPGGIPQFVLWCETSTKVRSSVAKKRLSHLRYALLCRCPDP
jgi:hypothetical protein